MTTTIVYATTEMDDDRVQNAYGASATYEGAPGCWTITTDDDEWADAWRITERDGWAEWTDRHGIAWTIEA